MMGWGSQSRVNRCPQGNIMIRLLAVAALLVSLVGCSDQNDAELGAARHDAMLRLLVVDDPELAAAAGLRAANGRGRPAAVLRCSRPAPTNSCRLPISRPMR